MVGLYEEMVLTADANLFFCNIGVTQDSFTW